MREQALKPVIRKKMMKNEVRMKKIYLKVINKSKFNKPRMALKIRHKHIIFIDFEIGARNRALVWVLTMADC